MLDRRAPASDIVELALRALPRETDEQNVQRILGYARPAYWTFLSEADRRRVSPRIEQVLTGGLAAAPTQSLKSAWFAALRDVAESEATVGRLERIWRKTENVPGLTLAEPDYITLALELAVRELPRGRPSSTNSWRASRTRTARRGSRSATGPVSRPGGHEIPSSSDCTKWRSGSARRGCSKA